MSKVNASIFYMLGSFIFLLSVIIPQFANAQEDIPKINEKQKEALELFSNSQSQHQQTSAVDIQQNNLNSDKNILKKIIQQELQEKLNEQEKQEQTNGDNQQQINPIKAIENFKSLKEQGQEQVMNNDKEINALELFFNTGIQQQEIQQQSNEGKEQQVKSKTATTENFKPVKEQGQELQQQQVKQGIQQKADSNHQQKEPVMLFFNAQGQEQQQQYVKQQQQLEQGKQKLQEKLKEQKKQQQEQQQTINQQQIEQEIQQKLEQEKQKLQGKLNEQKKQGQTNEDNEQVTVKSLKPIKEQSEKPITKEKVKPFLHNHVKKN